jgi:alkanesulfonate monooxygenase SsuD/methylene tetrahydromethanopterin reductase-like flavin-dependent oxidoreductase (luciferase family)
VVLASDRNDARHIGDRHTQNYLRLDNYRNNLLRIGWSPADLEPPGSDALFDAVMAWGDVASVRDQIAARLAAGADQVVLNLITADRSVPYLDELRTLASLNADFAKPAQHRA